MKKIHYYYFISSLLFSFTLGDFSALAQENTVEDNKLKVFIECSSCDLDFIKQEVNYLSYVRDRLLSDVQIQVFDRATGSGGQEYTFFFFGRNEFEQYNDTLVVTTDVNQTRDEIRRFQLKTIELGLVPFLIKKGFLSHLSLSVSGFEDKNRATEGDPWKNWVFSLNGSTWFNGQESYNISSFNGNVSADKITESFKYESSLGFYYNLESYKIQDSIIIRSESRSQYGYVSLVKSLNAHWSAGLFLNGNSSLYDNYKLKIRLSPGIEYNIFPYEESTKHQVRMTYKIGTGYSHYNEVTVYNKLQEHLFFESLGISSKFKEKWGTVSASVRGSHYFHDFKINSINFGFRVNLRIWKGLSYRLSGNLRLIHDQISLPLAGATPEEILLQQRQLQTGYRYWGNMGLTYTFGSIYNNVVNPRFGN